MVLGCEHDKLDRINVVRAHCLGRDAQIEHFAVRFPELLDEVVIRRELRVRTIREKRWRSRRVVGRSHFG